MPLRILPMSQIPRNGSQPLKKKKKNTKISCSYIDFQAQHNCTCILHTIYRIHWIWYHLHLRSRRLSRVEIQRWFHRLGNNTNRIIDLSFLARSVIELLIYQAFKSGFVATLHECKLRLSLLSLHHHLSTLQILTTANALLKIVQD